MLESMAVGVVAASLLVGYLSRSYVSAIVPMGALVAAIYGTLTYEGGSQPDEVDVIPNILVAVAAVALGAWLLGARWGRRKG